jgi:hypothetical protein
MLSIGEDLVFVEMVHDVAVDYMLQYLSCDGGDYDVVYASKCELNLKCSVKRHLVCPKDT